MVFQEVKSDAQAARHGFETLFGEATVRVGVAYGVHRGGTRFPDEGFEFRNRVTSADGKAAASFLEGMIESREGLAEELLAEGAGPAVVFLPSALDVDGEHFLECRACGVESRVV
jgi:hypothetical protein